MEVDFIDESEVLTPADPYSYIAKKNFKVPFVCGCRNLGEALRRINEGAVMIRTKGEAGTGDISEAVKHAKILFQEIRKLKELNDDQLICFSSQERVPVELVKEARDLGRLPVVTFAAGGVATPADAALMMRLGMDGVFVGSGIFKSSNPEAMARSMVQAVTHFEDATLLAQVSEFGGDAMAGINAGSLSEFELLSKRGD